MAKDLTLVYGGILDEIVGDGHGLPKAAIDGMADRVREAHASLAKKRDSGAIGFFDVPSDRTNLPEILETARDFRKRFENLVVLGIGGSALGATALVKALGPAFAPRTGGMRVQCLDNVDPAWIADALAAFPLDRTAFVVTSKSGKTPETLSQYLLVRDLLTDRFGGDWRDHIAFITDAAKGPLRDEASRTGAPSFPIHDNVGGRFSVLTPVGLLPAACAGVDVEALLDGAKAAQAEMESPELMENRAHLLGTLLYLSDTTLGLRNHVLMPYHQGLWETAFWYRQLWAESLGKSDAVGPTPIAALGTTDQHSQMQLYMEGPRDKVVIFLEVEDHGERMPLPARGAPEGLGFLDGKSFAELLHAELVGSRAALLANGRPSLTLRLPELTERTMGALLQTFMVATALAGELYGIDAFDQPGVEAGKINAAALLGREDLAERAESLRSQGEKLERHRI